MHCASSPTALILPCEASMSRMSDCSLLVSWYSSTRMFLKRSEYFWRISGLSRKSTYQSSRRSSKSQEFAARFLSA